MFRPSSTANPDRPPVKISLDCLTVPHIFNYRSRLLTLRPGDHVTIGRASKNAAKNLQPSSHNAYFDCPVMSRCHAEIYLRDGKNDQVVIRDTGSLHGTFVNETRVHRDTNLRSGDMLRFGDDVSRLQSTHQGITVRVVIDRRDRSNSQPPQATVTSAPVLSTNTFKVPSDSGDDLATRVFANEGNEDVDVTPSDDEYQRHSISPVYHRPEAPPVNNGVSGGDSDVRSSAISQLDPVVIDDQDVSHPNRNTSSDVSPPASVQGLDSDSESMSDADSNGECLDEDGQGTYPEDAERISPEPSDDEGDSVSEADVEDHMKPEAEHTTSTLFDGSHASDDSESPLTPEQCSTEKAKTSPWMIGASLFGTGRTLPDPTGCTLRTSELLAKPSLDTLPGTSTGQCPSSMKTGYMSNTTLWPTTTYDALTDREAFGRYLDGFLENECGSASLADKSKDQFESATYKASDSEEGGRMMATNHLGTETEGENHSKKRKRATLDEDGEDETQTRSSMIALADILNDADAVDVFANDKRHDSTVESSEVNASVKQDTKQSETELSKTDVASLNTVARHQQKTSSDRRVRKKARTNSSVSLALTAAAGAVGGCVATISFLWSPLADRLLA